MCQPVAFYMRIFLCVFHQDLHWHECYQKKRTKCVFLKAFWGHENGITMEQFKAYHIHTYSNKYHSIINNLNGNILNFQI